MSLPASAKFGSCCDTLKKALTLTQQPMFFLTEKEKLFLTVGSVEIGGKTGWFDAAVLFCPFCGKQLQSKEELKSDAESPEGGELG